MTTPTLPDRLLAEADFTRQLFPVAIGPDLAHLKARESMLREAAAALSGRVPEGDMARALEWVRAMVGDNAGSRMHLPAIEEAIATYDPERAGAFSGKLSGREAVAPPPGDGWVLVPREPTEAMLDAALRLQGDDAFLAKAPAVLSAFGKIYRAMIAAAPSAKGVKNG